MDLIRIRGLEIDCIVGVRPLEREREQRVHIELALGLDLSKAGRTGRIGLTCDYDEIATEVMAMLRFRHYHLIEMATEEISAMLIATHPALELVEIRLDKPKALDGRARAASVEIQRNRAAFPTSVTSTDFGATELYLRTRDAELSLFRIEPGRTMPAEPGAGTRMLEWVVSGDVFSAGAPTALHVPVIREPEDEAAPLQNHGATEAVVFRCSYVVS